MKTRAPCLDVIVPIYKNAPLTRACLDSLWPELERLAAFDPRVILMNDSPHDLAVRQLLLELDPSERLVIRTNEDNIGFVKSVDRGLEMTTARNAHCILLNTDTIVFPGALTEMLRIAQTDEMIGFVSPRSNNASICTLPHLQSPGGSPLAYFRQFERVSSFLPEKTYSPTAVGFCMFIHADVIQNIGVLDWAFGHGYEEENDLVLRANKVGYCAVIANRAFVYHYGSVSFSLLDGRPIDAKNANLRLLVERHPEFIPSVTEYMQSPQFKAESLISAYAEGGSRYSVLFDLSSIGDTRHGTSSYATKVLTSFATRCSDRFEVFVRCNEMAFASLRLSEHPNIRCSPPDDRRAFAIGVRLSQPFRIEDLLAFERSCVSTVYAMLDTIAYDCLYLRVKDPLAILWQYVGDHASGIIYISDFAKRQYRSRFRVSPDALELASLLSTDAADYRNADGVATVPSATGRHILVVGNHFRHKDTVETTRRLQAAFQNVRIVVLGSSETPPHHVASVASGNLTDVELDDLYRDASVVVLPSYYEGFGLGLMHAIALGKRIAVRAGPAATEIISHFDSTIGIVTYRTYEEMITAVQTVLDGPDPDYRAGSDHVSWASLTDAYAELFSRIVASPKVFDRMSARLHALDLLRRTEIGPTPVEATSRMVEPDARLVPSAALAEVAERAEARALSRDAPVDDDAFYALPKSTMWYSLFKRADRFAFEHPIAYRRLRGLLGGKVREPSSRGDA